MSGKYMIIFVFHEALRRRPSDVLWTAAVTSSRLPPSPTAHNQVGSLSLSACIMQCLISSSGILLKASSSVFGACLSHRNTSTVFRFLVGRCPSLDRRARFTSTILGNVAGGSSSDLRRVGCCSPFITTLGGPCE